MSSLELPHNPVQLAEVRAQESIASDMAISAADERLLAELDHGAESLGFLGTSYFVESGRALLVPTAFEADEPVSYTSFFGLTFEGRLATYSKVHIGRIIGAGSVRAVCLTFTDVTLLPFFDTVPDNELLYVPVLAVQSIEQTAA